MAGATYSLWLRLPGLDRAVERLTRRTGTDIFPAHLTLAGGLRDVDGCRRRIAEALACAPPPRSLRFHQFGTRHEERRWLCLQAAPNRQLSALFSALESRLADGDVRRFAEWPHVSLLYGTAGIRSRWPEPLHFADGYGDGLFGEHVTGEIGVWETSGPVSQWRPISGGVTERA